MALLAVVWSWRQHERVPTKKAGRDMLKRWKEWQEALGHTVRTCGPDTYVTDTEACVLHEYDPETHERIWWKPPKPRVERAPRPPAKRRGRKPIGV